MTALKVKKLSLHTPVNYQIAVGGILDECWATELEMVLTYPENVQDNPVTVLTGQLADQAALLGLLMRLDGLGLPLISVKSMLSDNFRL